MHTSGIVGFSLHAIPQVLHFLPWMLRYNKGFIDERASLNPTTADPPRTADEGEDEDNRDDEMSEPTQITRTEKRTYFQTDEKSKRVTGNVT